MTAYQVTAPLVQALVDKEKGVYVHVYEKGLLPHGVDKDQLKQLVETGMVEKFDAPAEDAPASDEWSGPDGATVEETLAYVGDDSDRAAEVLEQEQAGKNRSTLVAQLEKIADPAAD